MCSIERRKLLNAYGAKLVLTDGSQGMKGCLCKLHELIKQYPNNFAPDQFSNPANPMTHYNFTGSEIWKSFENKLDIFVCGTGTGGSFSGVAKYVKEKNNNIYTVAVEPMRAPFISTGVTGPHNIQGMGMSAGFIPETFDPSVMDEIATISYEEAQKITNRLAKEEGVLGGISSGANLATAINLAKRPENKGKKILTLIMDTGERYLSSGIFY